MRYLADFGNKLFGKPSYIYRERDFWGVILSISTLKFRGLVWSCMLDFQLVGTCLSWVSWISMTTHFFLGSKRRLLHVSFKHPTGCPWEPPSVGPLLSCGKFWRLTREWNFGNLWVPQVLPPILNTKILSRRCFFNGCFLVPLIGIYKWYILPIGGLYGTYHLLREPGNNHCFFSIIIWHIWLYIWLIFMVNVYGKYTIPMDPMRLHLTKTRMRDHHLPWKLARHHFKSMLVPFGWWYILTIKNVQTRYHRAT